MTVHTVVTLTCEIFHLLNMRSDPTRTNDINFWGEINVLYEKLGYKNAKNPWNPSHSSFLSVFAWRHPKSKWNYTTFQLWWKNTFGMVRNRTKLIFSMKLLISATMVFFFFFPIEYLRVGETFEFCDLLIIYTIVWWNAGRAKAVSCNRTYDWVNGMGKKRISSCEHVILPWDSDEEVKSDSDSDGYSSSDSHSSDSSAGWILSDAARNMIALARSVPHPTQASSPLHFGGEDDTISRSSSNSEMESVGTSTTPSWNMENHPFWHAG